MSEYGCSCSCSGGDGEPQRFPHVTYDLGAMAMYVAMNGASRISRTVELTPEGTPFTVMLDIGPRDEIVGVEVLMPHSDSAPSAPYGAAD